MNTAASDEGRPSTPYRIDWTADRKGAFLDYLAATCNVSAAAEHIGVCIWSLYRLRRRDKRFAAQWAAAVESGYVMLETQLIGHALSGGGPQLTNGAVAVTGPIDVLLATSLLAAHRAREAGKQTGTGPRPKRISPEETDAAILRKLAAMKRGDARRRAARKGGGPTTGGQAGDGAAADDGRGDGA